MAQASQSSAIIKPDVASPAPATETANETPYEVKRPAPLNAPTPAQIAEAEARRARGLARNANRNGVEKTPSAKLSDTAAAEPAAHTPPAPKVTYPSHGTAAQTKTTLTNATDTPAPKIDAHHPTAPEHNAPVEPKVEPSTLRKVTDKIGEFADKVEDNMLVKRTMKATKGARKWLGRVGAYFEVKQAWEDAHDIKDKLNADDIHGAAQATGSYVGKFGGATAGAIAGAEIGASIGTLALPIPIVGTAVGTVAGIVVGGAMAYAGYEAGDAGGGFIGGLFGKNKGDVVAHDEAMIKNLQGAITTEVKAGDKATPEMHKAVAEAREQYIAFRKDVIDEPEAQRIAQVDSIQKSLTHIAQHQVENAGKATADDKAQIAALAATTAESLSGMNNGVVSGGQTAAPPKQQQPIAQDGSYTAQHGDSFYAIAGKLIASGAVHIDPQGDAKAQILAEALIIARKNGVENADILKEGQKLIMPTAQENAIGMEHIRQGIMKSGAIDYAHDARGHSTSELVGSLSTPAVERVASATPGK